MTAIKIIFTIYMVVDFFVKSVDSNKDGGEILFNTTKFILFIIIVMSREFF